jgi:predicted amidohydrolase YtcJ
VGREEDLGSLAPGFFADMVVFDRDLAGVPSAQLSDASVIAVFVAGSQVY